MELKQSIKDKAGLIENALAELLPAEDTTPTTIHQAMRYSCLGGGKRLRAILALEACKAVGGNYQDALDFACAIEMIHAYTLIHDDLPAMDNDDYRRGKLTNHKVYGEGIAILAGDALLTYAFQVIADMNNLLAPALITQLIQEVTRACGSQGLIGGQVIDIQSEGHKIDLKTLEYIHQNKTSELFLAALRGGALIGGATVEQLEAITTYGKNFGMAFQITDDILDVVGDAQKLGKSIGSDVRQEKTTYPDLFGLDKAKSLAHECVTNCIEAIKLLPYNTDSLGQIARLIIVRES